MKKAGNRGRKQNNRSLPFVWLSAFSSAEKKSAVKLILSEAKKSGITTGLVKIVFTSRQFGKVETVGEFQRPDRLVCLKESAENLFPKRRNRLTVLREAFSNAT